jgi:hypothetical protein
MDSSRLSEKPHIFRRMTNAQRECGCVKSLSPLVIFSWNIWGWGGGWGKETMDVGQYRLSHTPVLGTCFVMWPHESQKIQ